MKTVRNRIKVSKEAVKQQPYIMQPLSKSASERIVFDPSLTIDSRYGNHIAPHPASKIFFCGSDLRSRTPPSDFLIED